MVSNQLPSTARDTTLSKRAQTILKLLMALMGPLLCLILLEGIAFVWEKKQAQGPYAWELVASRRIEIVSPPIPGDTYTLMKPGSHYEWQGIPVDINSQGIRDRNAVYEKPPGTFRILNVGDSISMGWGIREEDTYGKQLEALLNNQADGKVKYEVVNAGVPDWNLANELSYLQADGLKYKPDLILLEVTIVNDIYGGNAHADGHPTLLGWLSSHTYFWPFLAIQYQEIKAHSQGNERIPVLSPPEDPAYYFPQSRDDKTWDKVYSHIAGINKIASNKKIPMLVIFFPIEYQVVAPSFPRLPQAILSERAGSEKISVIDLLSVYEEACINKVGGQCKLEDRYLFADLWMHPSVLGSRIAAESIFARIKTDLLLHP